jgi:hypothetical protein
MEPISGPDWPDGVSPAQHWEAEAAKRALDELFQYTRQYRSSESYHSLLEFIGRFRFYSPFNAMLVHVQMPGARFVATAGKWLNDYGRTIRPNAQPLVMLQPMGPVMFVFDVSDTIPGKQCTLLPPEVAQPFETQKGYVTMELELTIENARRDGILVLKRKEGSQSAGSIRYVGYQGLEPLRFPLGKEANGLPAYIWVPTRYSIVMNENLSRESQYATLIHELAHLYCGHLGTPNASWWPDRRGLELRVKEFEAESISYLVCQRLGIDNPSSTYLSNYMKSDEDIPFISFDCIMKVSGLIEQMAKHRCKPRKEKE